MSSKYFRFKNPGKLIAASLVGIIIHSQDANAIPAPSNDSHNMLKGFYIRGEGGYSMSGTAKFKVGGNQLGWDSPNQDFSGRIGNSSVYGFGAGYRFTNVFRAEITYHQRDNFVYSKLFFLPVPGSNYVRSQNMKNKDLTLEGYLDTAHLGLGTDCINPFIGLGVGIARNKIRDAVTVVYPAAGGIATATFAPIVPHTKTTFTWNGTVGIGFKPFHTCTIDLGYRYVDMGTFVTGASAPDFGGVLAPLSAKNVPTHEVYVGVRVPLG